MTIGLAMWPECQNDAHQNQSVDGGIKLGGVQGQGMGRRGRDKSFGHLIFEWCGDVRKAHAPGQVAAVSIAATVEKAAKSANGQANTKGGSDGVGHREEREPLEIPEKQERQRSSNQATVENDPALPYLEDVKEVVEPVAVLDHKESPGADKPSDKQPCGEVERELRVQVAFAGPPSRHVDAGDVRKKQHQSIAEDFESTGQFKEDRPHG